MQICHQIALVFFPIGSAMAAMQRNLMLYVESAGCLAPRRSQPNQHVPVCPPLGSLAGSVYTPEHLAVAWNRPGQELVATKFEGRPGEYLTQLLPRVMFDYIASLVSIGMRIDAVAQSHGVSCAKALDIIKSQVHSCLPLQLLQTSAAQCRSLVLRPPDGGKRSHTLLWMWIECLSVVLLGAWGFKQVCMWICRLLQKWDMMARASTA